MPIKEIKGYAVVSPENEMFAFCVADKLDYRRIDESLLLESNKERMLRIRNVDRMNRRLVRLTLTSSELIPVTDSFNDKKTRVSRKRAKK